MGRQDHQELQRISIHALREEGDYPFPTNTHRMTYFYPRPPRGGRHYSSDKKRLPRVFLSTPSARRATACKLILVGAISHFYPRPPRGGRHPEVYARRVRDRISIHALREEGDLQPPADDPQQQISIHALREEGDPAVYNAMLTTCKFLSTPSARRATDQDHQSGRRAEISIHALREEGDTPSPPTSGRLCYFYPRPPRGGRRPCTRISTTPSDFYPRPPRGGRQGARETHLHQDQFLSTPSARRATCLSCGSKTQ